jgi:hypothetical protein
MVAPPRCLAPIYMTVYEFNALPYERQLVHFFNESTFLAQHWKEEDGINLYHLPSGFFVEIYYDTHVNQIMQLRSFTSAAPLENYTLSIELP